VHAVRGDPDRLADAGQGDGPLAQHRSGPDGQVVHVDAGGLVGLLEVILAALQRVHVEEPLPVGGRQAAVADAALVRHRGLDQVPGAVHLVAGGQPRVPRLAADLEVRVKVAVRPLGLLEQAGDAGGEGGQLGAVAVGQLPADRAGAGRAAGWRSGFAAATGAAARRPGGSR
jgi:hypothetical protein